MSFKSDFKKFDEELKKERLIQWILFLMVSFILGGLIGLVLRLRCGF